MKNELAPQSAQPSQYSKIVLHSVVSFLGQSLMQIVDLFFCRDLGSVATATIGTSTSFFAWFMIGGLGLISSLEYFIPNRVGARDFEKANSYFHAGILLGIGTALLSVVGLIFLSSSVAFFGVHPDVQAPVIEFCSIVAWSYIPVFLVPVYRIELQSKGHPHDSTIAFLFANILNVFLNWALVLGHAGFSPMGTRGSAWANLIARIALLLYLWIRTQQVRNEVVATMGGILKAFRDHALELIKKGIPISTYILFEMGAFVIVSMLAARMDPSQSAAHSIVITFASFLFMIPVGLSSAAATTLSHAHGKSDRALAIRLGKLTIRLGLIYACIGCTLMLIFRHPLLLLYTTDPKTISVGMTLLFIVAVFQFGDAMQVILSGCLRGFGETQFQAKANAFGYGIVGLPLGLLLAFQFQLQIVGLWIGLSAGLFVVAGSMYYRWKKTIINNIDLSVNAKAN